MARVILYKLGRNEVANEQLDRALEIEPDNVYILNSKGDVLTSLEEHDEAIEYYDRVLQIDPDNAEALNGKRLAQEQE